jgi:vitamin B12/bleomycin/antimicrobial peptide transport system ATP-binding/permease protein
MRAIAAPTKDLAPVTHPSRLRTDPRSYKLDARFFRRMYTLAKPYWVRKGAWGSWIVLIVLLIMAGSFNVLGAYFSFLTRDQTNALIARKVPEFWYFLTLGMAYLTVRQASGMLTSYMSNRLHLHWRQWLTTELVDRYLERRTYYEIANDQLIDNPDQRISEEVRPFCSVITGIPFQLIAMVTDITVQAGILMGISKTLFAAVAAFAAIKTVLVLWLYKPTIKQHYDITVSEADLRYGILHVRDNAETIAFYRGEFAERGQILERLRTVVRRHLVQISYSVRLTFVRDILGVGWTLIPLLVLTPMYFAREIEYGTIAQATGCAAAVLSSLSIVMNFIPLMSAAVPNVVRLAEIHEKFEEMGRARESTAGAPRISFALGKTIELEKVSLQTPGGEQRLVKDLSLKVGPQEHLVIVGRTGVGKSSLLRAMAGLWTRGEGLITMPSPDDALFLPQRPYMILSDLRSQLLYPRRRDDLDDADLQAILERVSLGDLAEKHGGFAAEKDWGRVLSLGEQQRIGFARALVAQPRFVFLDEATSAVDVETERLLYGLLARSTATFVSVGHRPTMLDYHVKALRLMPEGAWEIMPARRAQVAELEDTSPDGEVAERGVA